MAHCASLCSNGWGWPDRTPPAVHFPHDAGPGISPARCTPVHLVGSLSSGCLAIGGTIKFLQPQCVGRTEQGNQPQYHLSLLSSHTTPATLLHSGTDWHWPGVEPAW